jgi:uncharacterized protein (DUF1697 family)
VTPVVASLHLIQREITMEGTPYQYVALLRGINVGGHTLIKMADLRKLFESFGLTDVVTYIQTGNVLFSTNDADAERLARQLEQKLANSFGNKMNVFVLSPAELRKAAAQNPFNPERLDEEQRCHLMFLSAEPDEAHRKALMTLQGEEYRFHIQDKVLITSILENMMEIDELSTLRKSLGLSAHPETGKSLTSLSNYPAYRVIRLIKLSS